MTDEQEPVGRARWTGVADGPHRRTMNARCRKAGHDFVTRQGAKSDWHEVYSLETLELLDCDEDFDVEWFS